MDTGAERLRLMIFLACRWTKQRYLFLILDRLAARQRAMEVCWRLGLIRWPVAASFWS